MKKIITLFSIFLMLLVELTAAGRGGDGHGDRGSNQGGDGRGDKGSNRGGGGERSARPTAAQSVQRSNPSMSRAAPQAAALKPQVSRPVSAPTRTASQPTRTSSHRGSPQTNTRNQVQQFIKSNPTPRSTQHTSTTPVQSPNRETTRDHRHEHDGQKVVDHNKFKNAGTAVRSNFANHYPNKSHWFSRNFWDQHHYRPSYYNYPGHWWAGATAAGIGPWLGWSSQPYYYGDYDDYGTSSSYWGPGDTYIYNAYPQPQQVYVYPPQDDLGIATDEDTGEWMPLGVFAVAKDSQSLAAPNMFVQLALSKSGVIAGTYYNATTDQTYELAGMVDPISQRAAWKIADDDYSPMVETGIYNLTQDEAPIRIFFTNGTVQNMLLVRVQE